MSLLSVGRGRQRRHLGFLMPPLQSATAVDGIVDRIKRLQDDFGRPFAFETGVNYLRPCASEIPDGPFWASIADRADCGILLDIHNLWVNEQNGRAALDTVVDALPRERVWEVHLAAGQMHKGYWLDSHSGLPTAEVLDAAHRTVVRLPALRAIILEIIPDYIQRDGITVADITRCLAGLRRLWQARGAAVGRAGAGVCAATAPRDAPSLREAGMPSPAEWGWHLARNLSGVPPMGREDGAADPGFEIYRDLIAMSRRGTIVETLPLTARYLLLILGEHGLEELLRGYWQAASPQPFASDEARGFAAFVREACRLSHLDEVLAFELAAHQATLTRRSQRVTFTCDPESLLSALRQGRVPQGSPTEPVEVEIVPPRPA